MSQKKTTFGAQPSDVARLLGIGSRAQPPGAASPVQAKATLLRKHLAGSLPLETSVVESLPLLLGRLCHDLLPMSGRPLGEVILDPQTPLAVLERIKAHAKKLAARTGSDIEHDVAIGVYFFAIASGLLHHGQKITRYSYCELALSFEALAGMPWITPEFIKHLLAAIEYCRARQA